MENNIEEEPIDHSAADLRAKIGSTIRELREDASRQRVRDGAGKFTLDLLATELTKNGHKVTSGQLGHVETGRKFPSLPLLLALADYFDTSLDFILGRTTNQSSIADIEEDLQTGGVSGRFAETFKRLPQHRRQEVINFAKFLLSQDDDEDRKKKPASAFDEWVSTTEVLVRRHGTNGEDSFAALLSSERPDLADALGIPSKKKSVQDR